MEAENKNRPIDESVGGTHSQTVPNSTTTLVLGILSIVTCWTYGFVGVVLGIIALVISKSGKAAYEANPQHYSLSSYNNLKAGRICAIIGLSISAVFLLWLVLYMLFVGSLFMSLPWDDIMENSRQY